MPPGYSMPAPARFEQFNPVATGGETRVGTYINRICGPLLEDVAKMWGAPESGRHGVRSGDYRMTLTSDIIVAADLYECRTPNAQNAASYIMSKWDQADTVIILLGNNVVPDPAQFVAEILRILVHTPVEVRPRRMIFLLDLGEDILLLRDEIVQGVLPRPAK